MTFSNLKNNNNNNNNNNLKCIEKVKHLSNFKKKTRQNDRARNQISSTLAVASFLQFTHIIINSN